MRVSILGCGWFGTALAKSLIGNGIRVKGSTTSQNKLDETRTHVVNLKTPGESVVDPDFFDCDVLVVANNVRMDDEATYLKRVEFTISLIKQFTISRVIFISSTSVYGDYNAVVDETTPPQPETLSARLLFKAEQLFQNAPFACNILRLGGLIGPGRDPGKFFAGKTNIGNGLAPVNLIHLDDAVGITIQLIGAGVNRAVMNAVFPDHPNRRDFYTGATMAIGLPPPAFVAERMQWKIVVSIFRDYQYQHPLGL